MARCGKELCWGRAAQMHVPQMFLVWRAKKENDLKKITFPLSLLSVMPEGINVFNIKISLYITAFQVMVLGHIWQTPVVSASHRNSPRCLPCFSPFPPLGPFNLSGCFTVKEGSQAESLSRQFIGRESWLLETEWNKERQSLVLASVSTELLLHGTATNTETCGDFQGFTFPDTGSSLRH